MEIPMQFCGMEILTAANPSGRPPTPTNRHSVNPQTQLDIEKSTRCHLVLVSDGETKIVGGGMVYPFNATTVVHGKHLLLGHYKVLIDFVHGDELNYLLPAPNSFHEQLVDVSESGFRIVTRTSSIYRKRQTSRQC